jgi:hypothetical protein
MKLERYRIPTPYGDTIAPLLYQSSLNCLVSIKRISTLDSLRRCIDPNSLEEPKLVTAYESLGMGKSQMFPVAATLNGITIGRIPCFRAGTITWLINMMEILLQVVKEPSTFE